MPPRENWQDFARQMAEMEQEMGDIVKEMEEGSVHFQDDANFQKTLQSVAGLYERLQTISSQLKAMG